MLALPTPCLFPHFSGLDFPTSVTSDPSGRVYISEKAGIIRVASSWSAPTTTAWLGISAQTVSFQYGDLSELGLSSITTDGAFVYGVYVRVRAMAAVCVRGVRVHGVRACRACRQAHARARGACG